MKPIWLKVCKSLLELRVGIKKILLILNWLPKLNFVSMLLFCYEGFWLINVGFIILF